MYATQPSCRTSKHAGAASQLSLGGQHSVAVVASHSSNSTQPALHTWGFGDFGVLGHGAHLPQHFPRALHLTSNSSAAQLQPAQSRHDGAVHLAAGGTHTLVVDAAGRVFACGRDEGEGRLGIPAHRLDGQGLCLSPALV